MKRFFLLCLLLPVLFSCRERDGAPSSLRVSAYNVQNLFDAVLDGTEYEEYQPSSSWTESSYLARVDQLGSLLLSGPLASSSVIFLEEVENLGVVETLVKRKLASHGLGCYAFSKREGDAIGIAMVSRDRPDWVRSHGVEGSRPILAASFYGESLILLGCHAKSRIEEGSEKERIALSRAIALIGEEYPSSLVIALGDFNEDPSDGYSADEQTAFVPVGLGHTALWSKNGSLVVSGSRNIGPGVWYNPWLDNSLVREKPGSYVYGGAWHQYDQILGSWRLFDGLGWEFSSFSVYGKLDSDGTPLAWNRKLLSGMSDHLAVSVELYSL